MAVILDGKKLRDEIFKDLSDKIAFMDGRPCLAVIIVGNNPASKIYVSHKKKACEQIGIKSLSYELEHKTSEGELLELIDKLNKDKEVNGVLVQLPLPKHIDEHKIIDAIDPKKDVDGFHPENVGRLVIGNGGFTSCTPKGIISLIEHYDLDLTGLNCVVVGRSNIVGKPISLLLSRKNATVTLAHSKTVNLKSICKKSDIIVAALGLDRVITEDFVKEGAIIIDVGINRNEFGKIHGDVDFMNVKSKSSYITPVPGGVGPMTIASLMQNVVEAYEIQKGNNE